MFTIVVARLKQKKRTFTYPKGKLPVLPEKFRGRPVVTNGCPDGCSSCVESCPVGALTVTRTIVSLDMGKCIYCHKCEEACTHNHIRFTGNHQTSAARRSDLIITPGTPVKPEIADTLVRKFFSKSLKLRQVSAGGCAACEADCNVLGTPAWDLGRFGIQFVA
ncbi:MAG: hypothetical protein JXJ04_18350, partial [Spirochaetales bacterium]|nr:hypothetical protein [Spirochaetales bacterium]